MEKTQYLYGFLLLFVSLFACRQDSRVRFCLEEAERLMESRPDSSLSLLESLCSPEKLPSEDYATWCLLLTQARDKNYLEHTSDSVIEVAVRYFEEHGPKDKYGRALYYKGRVCQELGKREDALNFYLQARDKIVDLKDYNSLFLICSHLGTLYAYQEMKEEALEAYRESYNYAVWDKDGSSISYSLSYMGRVHGLYQNWDSSIICYKKAIEIATSIYDISALRLSLKELATIYIRTRQSEAALSCLDRIESLVEKGIFKDPTRLYLTFGDLYRLNDDFVQAEFYLNKALKTNNLYTKRDAYMCFYYLNESHKDYKKAIYYNNLYKECVDSIRQETYQKNFQEITAKYGNEKLLNINNELKWQLKYRFFTGLLFTIVAILLLIRLYNILKRKNEEHSSLEKQICSYQAELDEKKRLLQENVDEAKILNTQIEEYEKKLQQVFEEETLFKEKSEIEKSTLLNKMESMFAKQRSRDVMPNIIVRLKKHPYFLDDTDWKELLTTLDSVTDNFSVRLRNTHPVLTTDDIKYCCLLKLDFSISEIAIMMNVKSTTVSRRKVRIKEHLDKIALGETDLDTYIRNF